MKDQDRYLRFVQWEEDDGLYVGYCPDLFPWGGVCHSTDEQEAYKQLCKLVEDEVAHLCSESKSLPQPSTRAMRDAVPA